MLVSKRSGVYSEDAQNIRVGNISKLYGNEWSTIAFMSRNHSSKTIVHEWREWLWRECIITIHQLYITLSKLQGGSEFRHVRNLFISDLSISRAVKSQVIIHHPPQQYHHPSTLENNVNFLLNFGPYASKRITRRRCSPSVPRYISVSVYTIRNTEGRQRRFRVNSTFQLPSPSPRGLLSLSPFKIHGGVLILRKSGTGLQELSPT